MKTEKQSFRQIARDCKVRVTFARKIQGQLDYGKIEGPQALVRDVAAGPAAVIGETTNNETTDIAAVLAAVDECTNLKAEYRSNA